MNYKSLFLATAVSITLTGCGLYKKYEPQTETPANVFGLGADSRALGSSAGETSESIARISWREFFTDTKLQGLIKLVLANNTDLNSARIAVEKSEAALKAAKLAYLPSIGIAPQGAVSSFDFRPVSKTYNLPLQLSWDVEIFGSITNKKRAAKAVLLQTQMHAEAVRANLISAIAQQYYMLQLLDRQMDILIATDSLWNTSLDTQKALYDNGKAFSTAVNQMEASHLNVKTQIVDTRRLIHATENAICRLAGITPQHIDRAKWWGNSTLQHSSNEFAQRMFDTRYLKVGVPAEMLERRPDIRMANHVMEEAFYNTQVARAAFYPSLTLSGMLGWTNDAGGVIVNPGKILFNAIAQLTQPIFARGKIRANYKISKLTEKDMQQKYVQTVIDAGNEVNEAIADCEAAREKSKFYNRQVEVLHEAYTGTHELMDNGKASYLEVLTAQETLLNAQLSEAMNLYDGAQALIALYIALGGGGE